MRWVGQVTCTGDMRDVKKFSVRKHQGNRWNKSPMALIQR